jgi:hypothetical protein
MNCFHGIQQTRKLVVNPSFSEGSSSGFSYEGDADDDSFESCSLGEKQKIDFPNFNLCSTPRTPRSLKETNRRIMSPASSLASSDSLLAYSVESETDSCDCSMSTLPVGSYDDNTAISTLTGSPNLVVNAFEGSGKVFHDTLNIMSEKRGMGLRVEGEIKGNNQHRDTFSVQKHRQLVSGSTSIASSSDTKTTLESIDSPISSSSSSPNSCSIMSPPALRSSVRTQEPLYSYSAPAKTTNGSLKQSPTTATLLPTFVSISEAISSPLHSSRERSMVFPTDFLLAKTRPRDPPDGSNSVHSVSKSSRVQAIKSRLRSMEANNRQHGNNSSFQSKKRMETKMETLPESKPSKSQSIHQDVSLSLAREVMALTFTAFMIYIGYLAYRDAQSNALQLQITKTRFLEQYINLASEARLRSLKVQQELVNVLDHTLTTLEERDEKSSASTKADDKYHSLVPTPSVPAEHIQSPTFTAHEQHRKITAGIPKRFEIPMHDFFIVQSLLD